MTKNSVFNNPGSSENSKNYHFDHGMLTRSSF